jgi:hypothetical protein
LILPEIVKGEPEAVDVVLKLQLPAMFGLGVVVGPPPPIIPIPPPHPESRKMAESSKRPAHDFIEFSPNSDLACLGRSPREEKPYPILALRWIIPRSGWY